MARYRHKDETDLAWNRIRRRITMEVRTPFRDEEERILNDLLTKAWDEYTTALGEGEVPEVESKYSALAVGIVKDALPKITEKSRIDSPAVD